MMNSKLNILFVDDEVRLINGLRRMLFRQRDSWEMYFALSGFEALDILSKNSIDILITDMRMPQMDGAELLVKIVEKYPGVIRIILSGHSDEELILKSVRTAHQFIAKPVSAEILVNSINRAMQLQGFLSNKNIADVINGIEELPSIPAIYLKLEQELNSQNVSLSKVGELISEDVSISAKILQIVNSAFFGLAKETADVISAVNILGTNIIKSILITLKFQNFVTDKEAKYFSLEKLWDHSQKVARIAQQVYNKFGDKTFSQKEVYAAGLLHDIGKIVLLRHPNYIEEVIKKNPENLSEVETQLFNVSHAEIGAYLLGIWNLPVHLVEAVANHHNAEKFDKVDLACSVYLANNLSKDKMDFTLPSRAGISQESWLNFYESIKD